MHRRLANSVLRSSEQLGHEAHAVLARVVGDFRADDLGAGRHEVVEADGVIVDRAGFHLAWAPHDNRIRPTSLKCSRSKIGQRDAEG
jgi:hypothetical protein